MTNHTHSHKFKELDVNNDDSIEINESEYDIIDKEETLNKNEEVKIYEKNLPK
jgi:hypothetical protein